jgi:hypothetical protein
MNQGESKIEDGEARQSNAGGLDPNFSIGTGRITRRRLAMLLHLRSTVHPKSFQRPPRPSTILCSRAHSHSEGEHGSAARMNVTGKGETIGAAERKEYVERAASGSQQKMKDGSSRAGRPGRHIWRQGQPVVVWAPFSLGRSLQEADFRTAGAGPAVLTRASLPLTAFILSRQR